MKYDHMVKKNGIYYPAGKDVPEDIEKERATEENSLPFSDSEKEKRYTRTEIKRMSAPELRELATKIGIDNALERSGNDLKELLIAHFGL